MKAAERKRLEAEVRALFVENELADASEQGRPGSVAQRGIVGASEHFGSDQNLQAELKTGEAANPSDDGMYPMPALAMCIFELQEAGQDLAVALPFTQEELQGGDEAEISGSSGETLGTRQHAGSGGIFS